MLAISRRTFLRCAGIAGSLSTVPFLAKAARALGFPQAQPCFLSSDHGVDEDFLREIAPGNDAFVTEVYALALEPLLTQWFQPGDAGADPQALRALPLTERLECSLLGEPHLRRLRAEPPLRTNHVTYPPAQEILAEDFHTQLLKYLSSLGKLDIADLRICGIEVTSPQPLQLKTTVNYSFVGEPSADKREQRTGQWELDWLRSAEGAWTVTRWIALGEQRASLEGPGFVDVTAHAFEQAPSASAQLGKGIDHWRSVLDGAFGIDIYGNNGVSVGDYDNDGFDDIYVCQPAGLPNRLYKNRGDGRFEDVSARAGVDVLDATSCALFVDFRNSGRQDLLVVRTNGPLLFLNNGDGTFTLKPDAFPFVNPPQGALTAAAAADYNLDGYVDVYFCLYSYYQGLSDYQYPTPYYDAQNGPPNFLFRNRGDGTFEDVTEASGLNTANSRYTLACMWNDFDNDGYPDLYVVNDFGRKVLYRNLGNSTFQDVSPEQGAEDPGEGMSCTWFDYDRDGRDDLYVVNMWEAAGKRVTQQSVFIPEAPESVRRVYRRDAEGNSLLHNDSGTGAFRDVTAGSGTQVGGWNWSSAAWDADGDGFEDLYIANGFVSGSIRTDLTSYYWRRIVAQSYAMGGRAKAYEDAWQQINEGIRSDYTWSGYQRNNFYVNNRDGSFTEAGAVLGLDCLEDGRAFSLADLDGDGRVEIILKNRNAPQLRVLQNRMQAAAPSIAISLRGSKANRDAIGAVVALRTSSGLQRQTVTAGCGFLSQHSKTLTFRMPAGERIVQAEVRWPGGERQLLAEVQPGFRFHVEQGKESVRKLPFLPTPQISSPDTSAASDRVPARTQTWLVDPIQLPRLELATLHGAPASLPAANNGTCVLFSELPCLQNNDLLRDFQQRSAAMHARGLAVVAVIFGKPDFRATASEGALQVLVADAKARALVAIFYRYLFQRHTSMPLPTVMLLNASEEVVKVYSGGCSPDQVLADLRYATDNNAARALPFPGRHYGEPFRHNYFTFGVAFLQGGSPDQAEIYFKRAVALNPQQGGAYYNLGLIFLNRNQLDDAQSSLEQAVRIDPKDANAWNNLGVVFGQRGSYNQAQRCFERTIELQPAHPLALGNLVKLYVYKNRPADARRILDAAVAAQPGEPETHFELAMFLVQQGDMTSAKKEFERVVELQPGNVEARNGLGAILMHSGDNSGAQRLFTDCLRIDPDYDRPYLNLATLLLESGKRAEAREVLSSFLQKHPDNQEIRSALSEVDRLR